MSMPSLSSRERMVVGVGAVVALVIGLLAVPRLLGYVGRFKSNEMLLVTVLGLCFGFSLLAAKLAAAEAGRRDVEAPRADAVPHAGAVARTRRAAEAALEPGGCRS